MKTRKVLAATLVLGTLLSSSAAMAHHHRNFGPDPHRFEQRGHFHERREFTHRTHNERNRIRHHDFAQRDRGHIPTRHRIGRRW